MSKARTLADAVAAGGAMRLAELATNGTNTVGLSAPNALAADVTWKLPNADGNPGQALLTDGAGNLSWGAGGGGGDVTGPASSTDNAVARFDGTTGKLIQNSNFVVSDSGEVTSGTWNGTPIQSATGGTGQTSYSAGQLLIGNNSGGLTKATLTPGSNVTITNGNGSITIAATGGGLTWAAVQTTGFTAVAGNAYPCNTTSAAFTVTLPATPSAGNLITLVDYAGTWNTNNLTINPNGNKLNGNVLNGVVSTNRGSVNLIYVDATQGWISYASNGTTGIVKNVTADFLVIAGGGGAGSGGTSTATGAGGGAGGYRTSVGTSGGGSSAESALTLALNTAYPITIGAGGPGAGLSATNKGSNGNNSVFATVTSTAGGGGASQSSAQQGNSGGSGGGGGGSAGNGPGGPGTANQGYAGGAGSPNAGLGYNTGGGGGGAGGLGGTGVDNNNTTSVGGSGGVGLQSNITGTNVFRGGGGGGNGFVVSSGGNGGGGPGANYPVSGTAGTPNTGGGGGGGGTNGSAGGGAAGGSGVVIIKVPDAVTATFSAGVTSSVSTAVAGFKIYTVTATSTTSETVTFN